MGCGGSIKCEKELFIISLMNFYSSSRLFICAEEELEGSGCLTTGRRGGGPTALWWQYCRKEIHCERISVLLWNGFYYAKLDNKSPIQISRCDC